MNRRTRRNLQFGRQEMFYFPKNMFSDSIFFEVPGGGGGGGEEDPPRRNPTVTAAKYHNDVNEMARHIDQLETDNYNGREKVRKANERLATLEGQLPEGCVVLTKEQAASWEAYTKLGKPDDLAKLSTENEGLKANDALTKREQKLREVCENPYPGGRFEFEVFKGLDEKLPEATYEMKEVDQDGQKVKQYFVKYKRDNVTKEQPVLEAVKEMFPKYMPALVTSNIELDEGVQYPELVNNGNNRPSVNLLGSYVSSRYGHNIPKPDNKS